MLVVLWLARRSFKLEDKKDQLIYLAAGKSFDKINHTKYNDRGRDREFSSCITTFQVFDGYIN